MTTVTFTEFRNHASDMLDRVERGESLTVLRHGRPIAEVCPAPSLQTGQPSWKQPALRLTIRGAGLSVGILDERAHEGIP